MQQQQNQTSNGQQKPGPAAKSPDSRVENPFGNQQTAMMAGASAQALAGREVAEVQAALVVAKKFPRDPVVAMDRILNACTRPGLAAKASYEYAKGGQDVSGASIRLAEVLSQNWGNIDIGVTELSRGIDARGVGYSECLAYAWDLETNFRDVKRFQVRHWRDTKSGGYAIKEEREIYELIANNGARRKRACILAVIPGDVQEAAERQCELTLKTKVDITPELIQTLVDSFAAFGVTKEMIEKRVQKRMDAITPGAVVNMRKIYNSLKDGMSMPAEWFDMTTTAAAGAEGAETAKTTPASKMDAMAAGADPEKKQDLNKATPEAPLGTKAGEPAKTAAAGQADEQKKPAETVVKAGSRTGKSAGKKEADKPAAAESDTLFGDVS